MHDREKSIITGGSEFDMIAIKAAIISFASCFSLNSQKDHWILPEV